MDLLTKCRNTAWRRRANKNTGQHASNPLGASEENMENNNYGWLIEGSPSLVLMLDESLMSQGIAVSWRERLDPKSAKKQQIPASELFDLDSNPEWQSDCRYARRLADG